MTEIRLLILTMFALLIFGWALVVCIALDGPLWLAICSALVFIPVSLLVLVKARKDWNIGK